MTGAPKDRAAEEPTAPGRPPDGALDMADAEAERLAEAGLLTEQQARAYILRDVLGVRRERAAERMDVAPSTLDGHLSTARSKVSAARETVEAIQAFDGPTPALADPDE